MKRPLFSVSLACVLVFTLGCAGLFSEDDQGETGDATTPDVDADGDGVTAGEDCNDYDASVYPGAADTYGDGADQNCDGVDGVDSDGDGWASSAGGGPDCDDGDSATWPGAAYEESDSDCMTDQDGDGWGDPNPTSGIAAGTDCDDTSATVYPGADEIYWDGIDQDCNGYDASVMEGRWTLTGREITADPCNLVPYIWDKLHVDLNEVLAAETPELYDNEDGTFTIDRGNGCSTRRINCVLSGMEFTCDERMVTEVHMLFWGVDAHLDLVSSDQGSFTDAESLTGDVTGAWVCTGSKCNSIYQEINAYNGVTDLDVWYDCGLSYSYDGTFGGTDD